MSFTLSPPPLNGTAIKKITYLFLRLPIRVFDDILFPHEFWIFFFFFAKIQLI